MTIHGPKTDHRSQLSWDDLRVALVLARSGSVRAAARTLGVSHSTVLRRLDALESATGVSIFERSAQTWELTAAGQDVFDSAGELEAIILGLERRVDGRDSRVAGPVRLTMPDPLLPVIAADLRDLSAAHPDIDLTVAVGSTFADLDLREADIALRVASEPPPDLVGRRVAMLSCAVYGTKTYLAGRSVRDLESLDWIGWAKESRMEFALWMNAHVPNARIALRVDSSWAVREALDADVGVAIVPCGLGETRGYRAIRALPELAAPLWVLTHADLRTKARVRVCRDFLTEVLLKKRPLFAARTGKVGGAK